MIASDYLVKRLPGLSDSDASKMKIYAGHIPTVALNGTNNLFFSLIEAEKEVGDRKLVIIADVMLLDNMA